MGEYFGKDCGKRSVPRGQGSDTGTIRTAQDVYPCIIPYNGRQIVDLNNGYVTPKRGERPMHRTTISHGPASSSYSSRSTTHHVSI